MLCTVLYGTVYTRYRHVRVGISVADAAGGKIIYAGYVDMTNRQSACRRSLAEEAPDGYGVSCTPVYERHQAKGGAMQGA